MASRSTATDSRPSRGRAAARIASLALLLAALAPLHVVTKRLRGRSSWPHRFLKSAAAQIGVRVKVEGQPIGPHSLILANHSSWLDILVLAAATGCRFVSKDSLGHGFVHWLADQNATLYVNRSNRRAAKNQALAIARALEGDKPVAVFPEGTTGPGTHLLPFRSTLLEAANFAAKDVEIRPVAIDFGRLAAEIAWFEEPAKHNIFRILGRPGTIPVTVRLLPPLDRSGDRKRLAEEARQAIAAALGFKSDAASPIALAQ